MGDRFNQGSVPLRRSRYFTRVLLGRFIVMVMRQETRMINSHPQFQLAQLTLDLRVVLISRRTALELKRNVRGKGEVGLAKL